MPEAIRYHAQTDALIAAVQDCNGEFIGIQRIYLSRTDAGIWYREKRSLGRITGGAVRLTPPAARLQIAESIEDALALMQLTGRATWAVPGAGFMAPLEPPAGCREITLAPDNDTAGREAVEKAARALTRRGLTVRHWLPPIEGDWCDVLGEWEERSAIQEEGDGLDRAAAETEAYRTLSDATFT